MFLFLFNLYRLKLLFSILLKIKNKNFFRADKDRRSASWYWPMGEVKYPQAPHVATHAVYELLITLIISFNYPI